MAMTLFGSFFWKIKNRRQFFSMRLFSAGLFAVCLALTGCPPPVSNDITYGIETDVDEGPPGLAGTVWNWSGYRLSFKESTVTASGSSTACEYSYDRTARTGNIETRGGFTVSEDFFTLTTSGDFAVFGGRTFENSGAALAGSRWVWGQTLIRFELSHALVNGARHAYSYDKAKKTGNIAKIGDFSLNADENAMSIQSWRGAPYPVTLQKSDAPPEWNGDLTGSAWGWQNAFNGWMVIEFMSQTHCIMTHTASAHHDATPWEYLYSWNPATSAGSIQIGVNYSEGYGGLGDFTIDAGRRYMDFGQWRTYPHGARFDRIKGN